MQDHLWRPPYAFQRSKALSRAVSLEEAFVEMHISSPYSQHVCSAVLKEMKEWESKEQELRRKLRMW